MVGMAEAWGWLSHTNSCSHCLCNFLEQSQRKLLKIETIL